MAFSRVGRTKIAAHAALLLVNIIVLALAARVNLFQEFFFIADLFPLGLSIVTFVLLTMMLVLDFGLQNAYTGRPQFEIGLFGLLSIFWLAFNAFSTARWHQVPLNCGSIPADFPERTWCKDLQALKAFVWIEWVMFFLTAAYTLRYTLVQRSLGNKHIFKMPLSRYEPYVDRKVGYGRSSEFFQI